MKFHLHPSMQAVPLAAALICLASCSQGEQQERAMNRARGFLEAGEHEKAKLEYTSIVRKDRNNGEAMSQIGRIWSLQGAPVQAFPYYKRAQELGKLPADLQPELMLSLATTRQEAAAQEVAREILKHDPTNAEALMLFADTSRTPEQIDAFRQAAEALPSRDWAGYHAAMVPLLLRAGQLLEAAEEVNKSLALDPQSLQAHLAAGAVAQANKDVAGVEAAYQMVSKLAPVRSHDKLRLAALRQQQGKLDEAQALVADLLKAAPDFLPALFLSAQLSHEAKAHEAALERLEKVFAIDSANAPARFLQADIWIATGQAKRSVEMLERLDKTSNGSPLVRTKLARSLMASGNFEGAVETLEKVLVRAPDREASILLAEAQLQLGNPAAVAPAMTALLEKDPQDEAATLMMARGLEGQRRFEEALKVLRTLTELKPTNARYHMMTGNVLLQLKKIPEARQAYEKTLTLAPEDESVWVRLLDLDLAEQKFDDALARAKARCERQPASASAESSKARVYVARKEWDLAEASLLKTLDLDPAHPTAHETLSRLYAATKRIPEAIQKVQERLAVNPKDVRALRQLAVLRTQNKEYEQAVKAYEQLLAALPKPEGFVLNNLAALYDVHLGNPAKAYELARQARALRPAIVADSSQAAKLEAASIADTLGWILYRRREFAEAYTLLQEASGVLSEHPEVQAHLGLAAAAMGHTEAAKELLTKAVAWPQEYPDKSEAQQRLVLLEGGGTTAPTGAELAAMAEKNPDDPLVRLKLAEALESEKKFPEAVAAYQAALKLNPELPSAVLKLGQLYAGPLSDPVKGMAFAKEARQLLPNDATAATLLGELAYQQGDHPWAYDLLREATATGVKGADALMKLGRAAYSVGKIEEARDAMKKALEASPESAAAAEATAFVDLTATPPPPVEKAEAVLKEQADSVPALMIRAEAQVGAGDKAAAVATYKSILAKFPNFAPARKYLAAVLAREPGTRDQAYDLALKARETLGDDPDLAETIAMLSYHRRDYQYAVELFTDAVRLRPAKAEALYYLALSQLALKEDSLGRENLSKAIAAGLAGPEAAEATRLLQLSPQ